MSQAPVPELSPLDQLSTLQQLKAQTRLLAGVEADDAPYLSCYLDMRDGEAAARRFIAQRAHAIRADLHTAVMPDFEQALGMLLEELARPVHVGTAGLAVVARAAAGGPFLHVLRLAVAPRNHLTFYRVPAIAPLLSLDVLEQRFTLLLAREAGIQVLDVDLGRATPRAWAAWPPAGRGDGPVDRRARLLRAALRCTEGAPLVLGGEPRRLEEVLAWLPNRATARLAGTVRVPSHLRQREAVDEVVTRLGEERRAASAQLADRLIRSLCSGGPAVAGALAAFDALCSGAADRLVIVDDPEPAVRWVCDTCGHASSTAAATQRCAACGRAGLREWQGTSELVRLATQHGVPVELVDSDELRYVGGVGCLLKTPAETQAMPEPAVAGQLDLVA